MSESTDWMPPFGESAPVDREFRRAVFLAVLPQVWAHSRTVDEVNRSIGEAWRLADESIAQEGA